MRGAYGWPRIWWELLSRGVRLGKQRVQKLMKQHGTNAKVRTMVKTMVRAKGKHRFKVTTDSSHHLPTAPNLLERQFLVVKPDQVWAGDITYVAADEGWLFQASQFMILVTGCGFQGNGQASGSAMTQHSWVIPL